MKRFLVYGLLVALSFAATAEVMAQPGAGRRRGGGSGVNPGQILGMLAFDTETNLTDEQLVNLRQVLIPIQKKQQDLMRGIRSGEHDFQDARADMMALRGDLLNAVSTVLNQAQVERLKQQMKRAQDRGGRGGRGGQGGRRPGGRN
jgi:hypothetical protein